MDGKWMAGYYMNSSTYRTAWVHHRILKIITGKNGRADAEKDIGRDYPTWTGGKVWNAYNLDRVRREANDLKHTEEGLYPSRGLTYEQALLAIDEILTLTEVLASVQEIACAFCRALPRHTEQTGRESSRLKARHGCRLG